MKDFRRDIPGWLHSNEVAAIVKICKMVPKKTCVIEIGVFAGRTTQVIANVISREFIYCVDPWPVFDHPVDWGGMSDYTGPSFDNDDVEDIFRNQVAVKFANVKPIKGFFPDALPPSITNKLKIGLIHWDTDCVADVDLMKQQFYKSWSLLCPGGILSGHTFAGWMPNVVLAARQFALDVNCDIVLPPSGSIWYMVKPLSD